MGFIYLVSSNRIDHTLSGTRVEDAGGAQVSAKRFLAVQFGANKVKDVSFSKVWYATGAQRDVWEVEGDVVVKTGLFSKETVHFKFQVDPASGKVIAFET
jgi:hypothetical protein